MTNAVAVPLWLLLVLLGAASWWVLERILVPSVRWLFRRKLNQAIEGGIVQALFPEGGLSRDGYLRRPKLGLSDYMVRGFDAQHGRDIVFIPVGVNYDRVLEDRSLLLSASDDYLAPGALVASARTLAFVANNVLLRLRNEWRRFGYAAVQFGAPLSLREYCVTHGVDFRVADGDQHNAQVATLAARLLAAVADNIPVLAVPLIALTLRADPSRSHSVLELRAALQARLDSLRRNGQRYSFYAAASSYAIDNAIAMMTVRRLLLEEQSLYRLNPTEHQLIDYYAHSIAHLFSAVAPDTLAPA